MTSESPRYIPITTTTTSSSYRSDRSTTHFDGPNTGSNTIRSAHELVHDTHRLDNPQDLYRQHRNEHLDSTTVGGSPGRSLSGTSSHSARRPETSTRARRILQEHAAAGHGHGLGLTAGIRARDGSGGGGDDDNGMALSFDDGDDDNYTHVPFPTHGGGGGFGLGASRGAPESSAINLPIRNHGDRGGHHSHYDLGTSTARNHHRNHRHSDRHSLHTPRPPPPREPKERTTTYFVQDNILMRISSISHAHSHSSVSHAHSSHSSHAHSHSQSGTHHHSYPTTIDNMNDPSGDSSNSNPNFTSHNTSDTMSNEHRGGGSSADHKRRKWYRDRMARIIQDIEPGLPPPPSSFSASTFSSFGRLGSGGRGAGAGAGAGGYNYMYPGMGSSTMGSGGAGAGAGTGGYGATNARDSGYESFSGSPGGSFGRGRGY
ncbi:hypothetical protein NEUTE2DRAFT_157594 [Neurospora tetrasperma FGSC 2509]|nr:hypothetical protein NEUTE2DRAFT_157594 [Neurospora tetrasperma FGSC 2509]